MIGALMVFQPTRPLRGATDDHPENRLMYTNFNPRAPCGARHSACCRHATTSRFQPTRPLRGATFPSRGLRSPLKFQPTRPLRGATLSERAGRGGGLISTHAPLAGRDGLYDEADIPATIFQPTRPLRGATIFTPSFSSASVPLFQPTRPLRGATASRPCRVPSPKFQPTRPLRGATVKFGDWLSGSPISTHAPLAGRDMGIGYELETEY